jgi:hypothetical protein
MLAPCSDWLQNAVRKLICPVSRCKYVDFALKNVQNIGVLCARTVKALLV